MFSAGHIFQEVNLISSNFWVSAVHIVKTQIWLELGANIVYPFSEQKHIG